MKLRKVFASVVASVLCSLVLGACTDIDDMLASEGNGEGKILKIEARVGKAQTRVSTSENWNYNETDSIYEYNEDFSWDSGDEIAIYSTDGSMARYYTDGSGMFTPVSEGLSIPADGIVRAVYPADGSIYDGSGSNCFEAETWVSQGDESIYLNFTSVMSKVVLRTYAEGRGTPVDIQPMLYSNMGISVSFNNVDWYNMNTVPLKKIYKSYGCSPFNPRNNYTLKYKLYGIFDVDRYIPESFEAGTQYDIMMKVPRTPTLWTNPMNNSATIKLLLPEGCSYDGINREDYEAKIVCGLLGGQQNETWTMPLPDISADSTLTFEVQTDRLCTDDNISKVFSLEIYEKNSMVYKADNIGIVGSDKMKGYWDGVESWTDEEGKEQTKTYEGLRFFNAFGHDYSILMSDVGERFNHEIVRISDDHINIISYVRNEEGDSSNGYYFYWLSGIVDNPAYPTKFKGSIEYSHVTDHWETKYVHGFEMTRKN